jgi:hypothetical protein
LEHTIPFPARDACISPQTKEFIAERESLLLAEH